MSEPSKTEQPIFKAIGVSRLRMASDGEGVTTLVAGHGCTLRCRYCLNPQCFLKESPVKTYSVQGLIDALKIDDLYFQATGGGVVFGGGEPLMQADFIHEFCRWCPEEWKISLESSLAVPSDQLVKVIGDIDFFFIDIKDMNPDIYKSYTGKDIGLLKENLRILVSSVDKEKVCIRIPFIEGYNTEKNRSDSKSVLEGMGYCRFDLFDYDIVKAKKKFKNCTGSQ